MRIAWVPSCIPIGMVSSWYSFLLGIPEIGLVSSWYSEASHGPSTTVFTQTMYLQRLHLRYLLTLFTVSAYSRVAQLQHTPLPEQT